MAETVSQTWQRITGKPWSEAKKMGLTDGSYSKNIEIQKRLNSGWNPFQAAPAPAPAASAAPAPVESNNIAQSFVDKLLPAGKKIEAYTGKPAYGVTQEEYQAWLQNVALPYAEATYGEYFAKQLDEYTKEANVASSRITEDSQFAIDQLKTSLDDYLSQSRTEQQRLEQDYRTAMEDTARKLGVNLEEIGIAKQRGAEDKDRQLAELEEDYARTGGRISDNQAKTLGRLLTELNTQTGRLTEDQGNILSDLGKNYKDTLDAQTVELASKGQTFSGNRIKQDLKLQDSYETAKDRANLEFGRKIGDVNQNYKYNSQDVVDQAQQNLEDLRTDFSRSTEGVKRSYQRNLADLTRQGRLLEQDAASQQEKLTLANLRGQEDLATSMAQKTRDTNTNINRQKALESRGLYDIQEQLRKKRLETERQKQAEIETGYFGVGGQYDRATNTYLQQKQSWEDAQKLAGNYA